MRNVKKTWNTIQFDEDELLEAIYQKASQDSIRPQRLIISQEENMNKNVWKGLIGIGFALLVVLGLWLNPQTPNKTVVEEVKQDVVAYIAVDINPSFELAVLEDGTVSTITALNEDAETLDTTDLIGLPSEDVIEEIVLMATEAGFIDTLDAQDDYVVLTTVIADETSTLTYDYLMTRLQTRIQDNTELQNYYFVELKSDMVERLEAEGQNVPLGLYIINGTIETEDGTILSAKEFFSNPDNVTQLQSQVHVNITQVSQEQLTYMITAWLSQLSEQGIDVSSYQTQLESATYEALVQLHDDLKDLYPDLATMGSKNESAPQGPSENAPETKQSQPAQDGTPSSVEPSQSAPETTGTPSDNSKKPSDKGKSN